MMSQVTESQTSDADVVDPSSRRNRTAAVTVFAVFLVLAVIAASVYWAHKRTSKPFAEFCYRDEGYPVQFQQMDGNTRTHMAGTYLTVELADWPKDSYQNSASGDGFSLFPAIVDLTPRDDLVEYANPMFLRGRNLVVSARSSRTSEDADFGPTSLWRVPLNVGESPPSQLTHPPAGYEDSSPASGDDEGSTVYFVRAKIGSYPGRIYSLALDTLKVEPRFPQLPRTGKVQIYSYGRYVLSSNQHHDLLLDTRKDTITDITSSCR